MRATGIELYSSDEVKIMSLGLTKTNRTDRFLAKALVGLDANEIVPNFYGFGLVNQQRFYDFTLPPREIVMRIVLNPNYVLNEGVSDVRDELYKAISTRRTGLLKIVFKSGATSVAQLYGYITKFEVPYVSNVPELQITMVCEDAMLRAIQHVELTEAEIQKAGNEINVTDALSTAPHGFQIETEFSASLSEFNFHCPDDNWMFRVVYDFVSGDVLHVSSEYGNKYLYVVKAVGGATVPLMDKVDTSSLWPIMFPGLNEWEWEDASSYVTKKISYRPTYWGL